jgi:hypothetical protein
MILQSDFDVGFEIEGFALESNYIKIKKLAEEYGLYFITGDCSIKEDDDMKELSYYEYNGNEYYETIVPFEINTKPLIVTPKNILKTINFFVDLYKNRIVTNNTCSLHMHVKLKKDKLNSLKSFYNSAMCLAYLIETQKYKNFKVFDGEKMEHVFWANPEYMYKEYERMKNNFENIKNVNHDKRRGLFHTHSIGTLEWRGPRRLFDSNPLMFLNNSLKSYEDRIIRYTKFLFNLIPTLRDAHNAKGIEKKNSLYWSLYYLKV